MEFTTHKRTSQQVAAFQLGNLIQQNINNSCFNGIVLAVFSNTIYLQDNNEEVYWIAERNLPMHRRCILADVDHHFVESGMTWSIWRGCLQIGKDTYIDLESAEKWTPYQVDRAKLLPLSILGYTALSSAFKSDKFLGISPCSATIKGQFMVICRFSP